MHAHPQKAYLEFFAPPELINKLFDAVKDFNNLTIHAASHSSTKLRTNARRQDSVTAVTWFVCGVGWGGLFLVGDDMSFCCGGYDVWWISSIFAQAHWLLLPR